MSPGRMPKKLGLIMWRKRGLRPFRFSVFFESVQLDNDDQVTQLLDSALIPRNHPKDAYLSETQVPHLLNMVWKAANVKPMFLAGM